MKGGLRESRSERQDIGLSGKPQALMCYRKGRDQMTQVDMASKDQNEF